MHDSWFHVPCTEALPIFICDMVKAFDLLALTVSTGELSVLLQGRLIVVSDVMVLGHIRTQGLQMVQVRQKQEA